MAALALALGCAHAGPAAAPGEVRLPDGSRYTGELRDARFHGRGRLEYASGAVYEGEFRDGLRHGSGRYRTRGGRSYEGEYRDGEAEGRGSLHFASGHEYAGEFRAGEMEGSGTFRFSDGAVYTGELRNGEFEGRGRFEGRDGSRYEGGFQRDQFEGQGTFTNADGLRYEGAFRSGDFEGEGVLTQADGSSYRGQFAAGRFQGHGLFTTGDGKRFEGDFADNDFTGRGSITLPKQQRYEGEVRDWLAHGQGQLRFENGAEYQGAFEGDLYQGAGVFTDAQGRRFEGQFERGRRHGHHQVSWRTPEHETRTGGADYDHGRLVATDVPELAPAPLPQAEDLLYLQPERVERALAGVAPSRPGVSDLYFVGFGSWGRQDVFKQEVQFAQRLFADQLGAAGRTLTLINHRDTLDTTPLASVTNLRAALAGVAARMDRSEDILFLFLSSHGSEQHELAVDLEPLPLQSLPAERLAGLLDELEFGWRVVVVSACFSGGFLEPLRNDHTLVLTASRADRMSFGCSDDAEFTYFGQAFLRDALAHEPSFVAAFEQARRAIAQREEREHFEHSEPQIATSPAIEAKLAEWLATLPAAPAARAGAR